MISQFLWVRNPGMTSWVSLPRSLSQDCHQSVIIRATVISRLKWGRIYLQAPSGGGGRPQKTNSKPTHVTSPKGHLMTQKPASASRSNPRKRERAPSNESYSLFILCSWSDISSLLPCSILLDPMCHVPFK